MHSTCSPQPQSTQVETQDFASHKQPCSKRMLYNIPHINMLSSHWRRKILYVTRVRAINKTVIKPSRDAKFCVSQTNVPQTDGKQYATYNDFPCVSQAAVPQTDAKLYTTYKHAFIPLETQNLASLQGSRHQYKILLTLLMRYFMPYPYVPSSLAIRTFWLSAKALFGLYIVFFFLHISDENQIVTPFFPRPVYSL